MVCPGDVYSVSLCTCCLSLYTSVCDGTLVLGGQLARILPVMVLFLDFIVKVCTGSSTAKYYYVMCISLVIFAKHKAK